MLEHLLMMVLFLISFLNNLIRLNQPDKLGYTNKNSYYWMDHLHLVYPVRLTLCHILLLV